MFKLICKIMESDSSRLISVVGMPGVGKTALVRNTIHHIAERRLLSGGWIFTNAQNIQDCEVYLKKFLTQVQLQTQHRPEFGSY
jgi:Ni2+-binding GTPase involved in maturation of urease and hydrogenase